VFTRERYDLQVVKELDKGVGHYPYISGGIKTVNLGRVCLPNILLEDESKKGNKMYNFFGSVFNAERYFSSRNLSLREVRM